ncbi:NAD(P)-binding protein [Nemania sp. FL0916]|nr:NAD(P)-binding protein [Nemania sp. FL0916]
MAPLITTWLVTGASSGIGQSICIAALDAGHRVIGATRDVTKAQGANPSFAVKGGLWLQLDPARPDAPDRFAEAQIKYDVDVLVNNAGYAFIGGVEDTSEEEVQDQMNVNFWGALRAVRAVLPYMRAKGRGHIVLISSGATYMSPPGRGAYIASKLAIEAIHECLKNEVEELGIKVLIVQPGSFRTSWAAHCKSPAAYQDTRGFSEGYRGTAVEQWVGMTQNIKTAPLPDVIKGDPDKAGREIVKAVIEGHGYLRLLLGPDCVQAAEQRLGERYQDLEATRAIAMSTDVEEATPSGIASP